MIPELESAPWMELLEGIGMAREKHAGVRLDEA